MFTRTWSCGLKWRKKLYLLSESIYSFRLKNHRSKIESRANRANNIIELNISHHPTVFCLRLVLFGFPTNDLNEFFIYRIDALTCKERKKKAIKINLQFYSVIYSSCESQCSKIMHLVRVKIYTTLHTLREYSNI